MNPYHVIGVAKTATAADIKQAYKRKAAKLHPDRGGDTAQFQELQHAYDILGDPARRQQYDTHGFTKSLPPIEETAIKSLMQMFADIVNQVPAKQLRTMNPLDMIRQNVNQKQTVLKKDRQNSRDECQELETTKASMVKDHQGLFAEAINQKIRKLQSDEESRTNLLAIGEKMLQLLDEFQYRVEEPLDFPGYLNTRYTTTTHSW